MPWDTLRSQSVVDTLLMFMLLAWFGGSAILTLLAGHAARRYANQGQGRRQRQRSAAAATSSADARQPAQSRAARSTRS